MAAKQSALITGHTAGLGRAISEKLVRQNWEVEGASRKNGYDITSASDRARLIEKSFKFEAFINNAHADFAQTQLLFEVHQEWRKKGKTGLIVNIGSRAALRYLSRRPDPLLYDHQKAALRTLSDQLSDHPLIKTVCVNFGYLKTPEIEARAELKEVAKLPLERAAEVLFWVLSQSQDLLVSEINIRGH